MKGVVTMNKNIYDLSKEFIEFYDSLEPMLDTACKRAKEETNADITLSLYLRDKYGNYTAGRAEGDWYGFFRVKAGSIKDINPGKAYLHLSTTEYPLADGGEIIMNVEAQRDGSIGDDDFYMTEYYYNGGLKIYTEAQLQSEHLWYLAEGNKIDWAKNWGVRDLDSDFSMAKFMGEIEDEDWMISLGLSNVEAKEAKSGDIYNLQGMKVAQPTKGIYIQNGKKYIVK